MIDTNIHSYYTYLSIVSIYNYPEEVPSVTVRILLIIILIRVFPIVCRIVLPARSEGERRQTVFAHNAEVWLGDVHADTFVVVAKVPEVGVQKTSWGEDRGVTH